MGVETETCNENPCPVNGGWGEFGDWEDCAVSCGGAEHSRHRECNNPAPAHGGQDCTADGSTDSEDVILNAFKLFDPEGKGTIPKDYLGDVLTSQADRFTKEELDSMMNAAPFDADGNLDYKGLAYIITHGQDDEDAAEE